MIEDAAARICAKAQARIFEPPAHETEPTAAENVVAATTKVSSASNVSIRTARRHKRAARRARIAEAARRASQVLTQPVAARTRAVEEAKPEPPQPLASAPVQDAPTVSAQVQSTSVASAQVQNALAAAALPASKTFAKPIAKPAKKESRPARRFGSSLLAWNNRLNRWASRNSTSKPRGKRLLLIGLIGIMLLVVAEVIGELAPAHVVHIAVGFMGMLFIDIALGLGLYLLLISRGLVRTRPVWAQALVNSWSWLTRRS